MSEAAARSARNILAIMKAGSSPVHTRVPVDFGEFKHLDLAAYDAWQEEMEAHGFRHLADYEILEVTNTPGSLLARTFLRTMVSREGKVIADYYQVKPRVGRRVKALLTGLLNLRFIAAPQSFLESMKTRHCTGLETELDDGRFITTSNAQGAGRLTSPPEIDSLFFPYGTAVDELMDAHYRRLVAALKKGGVQPLTLKTKDDLFQMQNRMTAVKNAFRASTGWINREELLKLSHGNAEQTDAVYAEIIRQRDAEGTTGTAAPGAAATAAAAAPAAPARPAAAAGARASRDAEAEDQEEEEQGSRRGGCLFFPLLVLGLVLMMVLPRGLVAFLVRHGFRFLLPREARAELDAARKAAQEAAERPVPQRVPAAGARPASAGTPAGGLAFAYDPERGELVAAVDLPAWAGYACGNSNPQFGGGRVLLRLRGVDDTEPDEADAAHQAAVRWLRANEQAVHDAILAALARYAPVLRKRLEQYGDDESARLLHLPQGWNQLIDLAYVDVFPYTRDGVPYFAFEFECEWDPEHGFKLLVNGTRVVHMDADGYGSEEVVADGGSAA